jgi:hypothetical protein
MRCEMSGPGASGTNNGSPVPYTTAAPEGSSPITISKGGTTTPATAVETSRFPDHGSIS